VGRGQNAVHYIEQCAVFWSLMRKTLMLRCNEVIVDVREKIIKKEVSTADPVTTAGKVVTAANVKDSVAPTTATTTDVDDELTLAKTLIEIKAAKPMVILWSYNCS
nr:hypothetical protein [Tanacetum cinerariifolium]